MQQKIFSAESNKQFEGIVTVSGEPWIAVCTVYRRRNSTIELDFIHKFRETRESIVEAFEQYEYHPSENREELMMDFFLIASLPIPADDDLAFALQDIRTEFYPWMKSHMLHSVEFAICAEFRHMFDRESPTRITQFFKEHNAEDFLTKYAMYYGAMTGGGSTLTKVISPKNLDIARLRTEFKSSEEGYKKSYQAKKYTKISDYEFMLLAKDAFVQLEWAGQYGGQAWANIADAWIKLSSANNDKDIVAYIDHIYDLEHNTGTMLNKIKSYMDADSSFKWIRRALDYKYQTESLYDLFDMCSPDLQKFAAAVIYSSTGDTIENWQKKGGKLEGYRPGRDKYLSIGDKVIYTGPRDDLKGLTGIIRGSDKGAFQVEFTQGVQEANTIMANVLAKYLEKAEYGLPITDINAVDAGDIVVCINPGSGQSLTPGKKYKVLDKKINGAGKFMITVESDESAKEIYYLYRFALPQATSVPKSSKSKKPKLQIGDKVSVEMMGANYGTYDDMAKMMNLDNWSHGTLYDLGYSKGDTGTIKLLKTHPEKPTTVVAGVTMDKDKKDILIGTYGLKKVEEVVPEENEVEGTKLSDFKEGDKVKYIGGNVKWKNKIGKVDSIGDKWVEVVFSGGKHSANPTNLIKLVAKEKPTQEPTTDGFGEPLEPEKEIPVSKMQALKYKVGDKILCGSGTPSVITDIDGSDIEHKHLNDDSIDTCDVKDIKQYVESELHIGDNVTLVDEPSIKGTIDDVGGDGNKFFIYWKNGTKSWATAEQLKKS